MDKNYEKILYKVDKPARYVGSELHSCKKDLSKDLIRMGFSYPDVYEVGMSYLGLQIIYNLINEREDAYCERVFAPWGDMEKELRDNNLKVSTLETHTPIDELDILAFTLQYELSYTNILNILNLGGIPFRSAERNNWDFPLIFAGGPCAYSAEPIADFVDFFCLGEGEEVLLEILDFYKEEKAKGTSKEEFLQKISGIEGIYVPSLYEFSYNEDGTIKELKKLYEGAPDKIKKRIIKDFDNAYFPEKFIVPNIDVVHDRAMVEVFRGCTKGCRFCQAGMIYRPIRERSADTIVDIIEKLLDNTGFEEMSLTSLSTLDHSEIQDLVFRLIERHEKKKVSLSLPSLRLDSFSVDIVKEIQKIRKTSLTFAPEAGTQRLRDVINKGVTEENLTHTMEQIFALGWNKVKLYFMMGLPTETYEDLEGIATLANKVAYAHRMTPNELRRPGLTITVSVSCYVPKPFTPFQWEPQDTMEQLVSKQKHLKSVLLNKKVNYNYHDADVSFIEGVFARGDRRLSKAIEIAYELGCKFDGWDEYFDYEKWMTAFEQAGIDPAFYANRRREYDEVLPWDHIDVGVRKEYLINENEDSKVEKVTSDCRDGCTGCGVNFDIMGGSC